MIPKSRPNALTTKKKNWDGNAARERAILSITAKKVSFEGLVSRSVPVRRLTSRKNETPCHHHKRNMDYNRARVFPVGKITHGTIGVCLSGCGWLGDIVCHVHVHGIMGGREGDERRKGDVGDHRSHLVQIICAERMIVRASTGGRSSVEALFCDVTMSDEFDKLVGLRIGSAGRGGSAVQRI